MDKRNQSPFNRRRRYLVHSFQYRLLYIYVLYFLVVMFTFVAVLFIPLMVTLESTTVSEETQQLAAHSFLALHYKVWPVIGLTLVLLILHSIILTHRIAGPLYRLRCVVRMVGAGYLTVRAVFRAHDYLIKERDAVNGMIAGLCDKVEGLKKETSSAKAVYERLSQAVPELPDGSRPQFEQLGIHLDGLSERLQLFKVPSDGPGTEAEAAEAEAMMEEVTA